MLTDGRWFISRIFPDNKDRALLVIIGGVLVIETLSVIIQIISLKIRKREYLKWFPFIIHSN
jgi:UDP-N-acetylmuramyl pentapeptide phosphotransferase/UDP-N-acetylglucosamine-1-phosphate transferase